MPSVLLVDDDEETCEALQRYLARSGCDVTWVSSGGDAVKLLRDYVFDVVVLDWMMPEVGGLEALRRLRADPATARVPVIVYSAAADRTAVQQEALRLGAADVVLKSGGFAALHERISRFLAPHKGEMP